MSFTQDDVKKLAHLARLAVDHSIGQDLDKILGFVSKISAINTDHIAPMQHAEATQQRLRPDEVTEPNVRDAMLNLVPDDAYDATLVTKLKTAGTVMLGKTNMTVGLNLAGLPGLSMPGGFVNNLPIGVQIIGNYFQEAKLLNVAQQYQQVSNWHTQIPAAFEG